MATSKMPVPTTPSTEITASSITEAGAGLIRLWAAMIALPITAATTASSIFARLISSVTAAIDGSAPQTNNEIVKATSDLVKAGTGLYVSLFRVGIASLESLTKSIDAAVAEATQPPRK